MQMHTSHINLPSGRLINIDDIIYVGLIEDFSTPLKNEWGFKITWGTRATMTFTYPHKVDAMKDIQHIKKHLTQSSDSSQMICD